MDKPSPPEVSTVEIEDEHGQYRTRRKLEARHIQMIAIGGTIGTGLFVASGATISEAGALGALLAFCIAGIAVFMVVNALGEMSTLVPVSGSFNTYAARFVDPALGFTSGWNYWFGWIITLPLELMLCADFIKYWTGESINEYWIMFIILIVLVIINCVSVKGYGEIEYWLALLKIIAIMFFLVVTTYVLIRDNNGTSAWDAAGGPFLDVDPATAMKNIINALISASLSFAGTELVGITAGEYQSWGLFSRDRFSGVGKCSQRS